MADASRTDARRVSWVANGDQSKSLPADEGSRSRARTGLRLAAASSADLTSFMLDQIEMKDNTEQCWTEWLSLRMAKTAGRKSSSVKCCAAADQHQAEHEMMIQERRREMEKTKSRKHDEKDLDAVTGMKRMNGSCWHKADLMDGDSVDPCGAFGRRSEAADHLSLERLCISGTFQAMEECEWFLVAACPPPQALVKGQKGDDI